MSRPTRKVKVSPRERQLLLEFFRADIQDCEDRMTKELALHDTMALQASDLPALATPLKEWAKAKLVEVTSEWRDLDQATTEAKQRKWKTSALRNATVKALARVTFYDKVVKALDAGYMLFPPVPNADLIAVRTRARAANDQYKDVTWSGSPSLQEISADAAPAGVGEYKDPFCGWTLVRTYKDDKQATHYAWELVTELKDAEFPVVMAKPQIVAATSHAMELKIFDEIRLFPFTKRRGDPCILGSIFNPREDRRLYFLISWRISRNDI